MYALFDADILVFRCGFAAERRTWFLGWGGMDETDRWVNMKEFEYKREASDKLDQVLPGVYSRKEGVDYQMWSEVNLEPLSHALQNVKSLVAKSLKQIDCSDFDVQMYLGGKTNFRDRVAVTLPYKGNRDRSHRRAYEDEIREFIMATWPTTVSEDEEADDLLGIAQTKYGPEQSVIISLDKDLDQIPGLKYNFLHDVRYTVTDAQATLNFHLQLLMGDSTDNITGLPGIGKGKANKALHGLEDPAEQLNECARMYQIHSGKEDWEKYMLEMGQLLWIRREVGQMWEPDAYEPDGEWDGMGELTLEVD
jgi:hypothetical protein